LHTGTPQTLDYASPPTFEIMGTKCIWCPATFATGCHFRLALWEASPDLLVKFKGRRKEEYGREWVKHAWVEQQRETGKGWREKDEDRPHVRDLLQLSSRGCAQPMSSITGWAWSDVYRRVIARGHATAVGRVRPSVCFQSLDNLKLNRATSSNGFFLGVVCLKLNFSTANVLFRFNCSSSAVLA